jgi:hypothetical protein
MRDNFAGCSTILYDRTVKVATLHARGEAASCYCCQETQLSETPGPRVWFQSKARLCRHQTLYHSEYQVVHFWHEALAHARLAKAFLFTAVYIDFGFGE